MNFYNLKTKTKILIGIGFPLVLMIFLSVESIIRINGVVVTNERVNHTQFVLESAAEVIAAAVDMETGMRGYLLAGQETFLEPYTQGQTNFFKNINELQSSVDDNPSQVARLGEMTKIIQGWQLTEAVPGIALRREIGDSKTMNDMVKLISEARGKTYFDEFRSQISTLINREKKLLETHRKNFLDARDIAAKNFDIVQKSAGWVDQTRNLLAKISQILTDAINMETGMRGFLLAGEDEFLEPYINSSKSITRNIDSMQKLISDDSAQVNRLDEINDVIQVWIKTIAEPSITLRRKVSAGVSSLKAVDALISKNQGKQHFDKLRDLIQEFEVAETEQLAKRNEHVAIASVLVLKNNEFINSNEKLVTQSHRVISKTQELLAAALNIETGMRGYLLAGKGDFLNPYSQGSKKFFELSAELHNAIIDNPSQLNLLNQIEETIEEWQKNVTEPNIALRGEIGGAKTMDDMADLVGSARGKALFDSFRGLMNSFADEERRLMGIRQSTSLANVDTTFWVIFLSLTAALVISIFLAGVIGNAIAKPVVYLTNSIQRLATGNFSVNVDFDERQDEIGAMAVAVNKLTEILRSVSQVADKISSGDTSVKVEAQGSKDMLAQSINSMVDTLNDAATQADVISTGDYMADFPASSEQDKLGIALQKMTEKLRNGALENAKHAWISEGLVSVSSIGRSETNLQRLGAGISSYLAKYLYVPVFAFYVVEENKLKLSGSYALDKIGSLGKNFELGEGLVGQAALKLKTISVTDIPNNYWRVNSSLGSTDLATIYVVPLVTGDTVFGVMELGLLSQLPEKSRDLLEILKEPIAIMIRSAIEQAKNLELLETTQRQSEELEAQSEELKSANDELKSANDELHAQQSELESRPNEVDKNAAH